MQKADEEEEAQEAPVKKKRKAAESDRYNDAEYWVMKRQRLKASKGEETLKKKRTVFVGNLPVSCTKKVLFVFVRLCPPAPTAPTVTPCDCFCRLTG